MNIFNAGSEQEKFEFLFNIISGYFEKKEFDKIEELMKYCLDNEELSIKDPSLLLQILICTKCLEFKKSANRSQLYDLMEKAFTLKFKDKDPKQLKIILMGLK